MDIINSAFMQYVDGLHFELDQIKAKLAEHFGALPDGALVALDHLLIEVNAVGRLYERLEQEESRSNLHADLNRRAARALGKPESGDNSTWHDIPEQIADLRGRLEASMAREKLFRGQMIDLRARLEVTKAREKWLDGLLQRAHALLERHDATAAELLWMAYSNPPQKDGVS